MKKEWKPILLRDANSIALLNTLFEHGWYLREYSDMFPPYLLFDVSPADLRAQLLPDAPPLSVNPRRKKVPILMLERGESTKRQMALEVVRNAQGYKDLGLFEETLRKEAPEWESKMVMSLPGICFVIIEQKSGSMSTE
ncbi:MAG: hypothetical protein JWQ98_3085 [Chlorobi bacterium]|nr:hypothetical protein [Chlorobiota bacterium]